MSFSSSRYALLDAPEPKKPALCFWHQTYCTTVRIQCRLCCYADQFSTPVKQLQPLFHAQSSLQPPSAYGQAADPLSDSKQDWPASQQADTDDEGVCITYDCTSFFCLQQPARASHANVNLLSLAVSVINAATVLLLQADLVHVF